MTTLLTPLHHHYRSSVGRAGSRPVSSRTTVSQAGSPNASLPPTSQGIPMKIKFRHFDQACRQRCKAWLKLLGQDAARARATGLLTDDIANGSSNTDAFERWHMFAAA